MNIVHVDETFHPAFGYQCNPLAKFQSKQGNDVSIVTVERKWLYPVYHEFGDYGDKLPEQDDAYEQSTGVKIVRVPARGYIAGRLVYNYRKLFSSIEALNPDVLMVHCFETLTALRLLFHYDGSLPMLFDSHMLSMASTNRFAKIYEVAMREFVAPKIIAGDYRVIKTQDDDYVTSHLGVPESQTRFISFGTDTDLFCTDSSAKRLFLQENGLPLNTFVLVSTGKLTEAKGGMLLAEAMQGKFKTARMVALVVVANCEGSYESEVKKRLENCGNPVMFYPVQSYLKLPHFYQIADASVYPRQCSMSFYDSEACGTPVISEDNSVNIERNSCGNGVCFKSGDPASLREAIENMANLTEVDERRMKVAARSYVENGYDYRLIAEQYTEELRNAIASSKKRK